MSGFAVAALYTAHSNRARIPSRHAPVISSAITSPGSWPMQAVSDVSTGVVPGVWASDVIRHPG